MQRGDGPLKIIQKVGYNAYKLQLLADMVASATFNFGDLSPYVQDYFEDPSDLRSNPFEEGEVNAGYYTKESSHVTPPTPRVRSINDLLIPT